MQQLKFVLSLLMVSMSVGCGEYRRFVSESPDGRARVIASVPRGLGPAFRVVLVQDGTKFELYRRDGFDTFHWLGVYWEPSGERVGILTCSSPSLYMAFDRRTMKDIPVSMVDSGMKKQFAEEFGARVHSDPNWRDQVCFYCCTSDKERRSLGLDSAAPRKN
jgi:hypothetical protein